MRRLDSAELDLTGWQDYRSFGYGQSLRKALIVEDDLELGILLDAALKKYSWETQLATSFNEAKAQMASFRPDLVILDWYLDNKHLGGELLSYYEEKARNLNLSTIEPLQIVTCSGAAKTLLHVPDGCSYNHAEHWEKPFTASELFRRVSEITNRF